WYWWRINALSEIVAMTVSFLTAVYFGQIHSIYFQPIEIWQELVIGIGVTTLSWVLTAFLSQPTKMDVLKSFLRKTDAPGPGWARVRRDLQKDEISGEESTAFDFQHALLAFGLGVVAVYCFLFGTGKLLFGFPWEGLGLTGASILAFYWLFRLRKFY